MQDRAVIEKASVSPFIDSLWEEFAEADVADVVVDVDAPELQPTYSYRVPEAIQNTLAVGMCVHVNFAGRETLGYVLARRKIPLSDPLCAKLKDILAIIEDAITINEEQIRTLYWMCERYVCDIRDALRCIVPAIMGARVATVARLKDPHIRGSEVGDSLPQAHIVETLRTLDGAADVEELKAAANLPGFATAYTALVKKGILGESRTIARAKVIGKKQKAYTLGAAAEVLGSGAGGTGRRSPQQARLLNELKEWAAHSPEPMPQDELLRMAQTSAASLRGLVDKGLVTATEISVRRAPVLSPDKRTVPPILTPGQQAAVETLCTCLDSQVMQTILLFGVTASGKTEVYLNAIAHALANGRSAIVLLPEIALTAQVVDVFIGRFGEQVAVLHSKLSDGERHDEWRRMMHGEARIVVGARSAIFAPVQNVGLIVVDEEHEASYKQEKEPRYNAKDLAAERARLSRAVLILGSATPSLESYYATETFAESRKRVVSLTEPFAVPVATPVSATTTTNPALLAARRIEMRKRIDDRPLPKVEVVDLREEFKQRRALFSARLTDAMADRLRKKQQIILFLNRRGYAQFVLCRDCGWVAKCPNCAVSLAFHAYDRSLKCHHCDYMGRAPQTCPDCGSHKVKAFGIGTEKVEEEVLTIFPSAKVARMDRDTTSRKGAHTQIIRDFKKGDADILIGTQMVAKGLDFPNVTLVGVVSADTAINMPDFRAAERTFQLLTQVAGRAGRGVTPGEVIIQTFSPDHYAVQSALHHDYESFYKQEILFRQELRYPPFSRFANLICGDPDERRAASRANVLAASLERVVPPNIEIIGPSAAPIARLRTLFRFHVALRAPTDAPVWEWIRDALLRLTPADRLGIHVDIDPLSMA